MAENELPEFESLEALVEFFETHDMGEYDLPAAHFDVELEKRTCLIAVDETLLKKLSQTARAQHVSTAALVNAWLEERAAQAA